MLFVKLEERIMTEGIGNNPVLPPERVNKKEIPLGSLVDGILSIPNETKRVEVTRIVLHCLLDDGRMVDSVDLLNGIQAEKLPFHEGERNNMLKGILDTAEDQCGKDPSDAFYATVNIRDSVESIEGKHNAIILTEEERGKFDREALNNTSVIVTRRLIECMLNPSLPRGRYEKAVNGRI